jgi:archaemetzincin
MVLLGVLLVGDAAEETKPKTYPEASRRARKILNEPLPAPYQALKARHLERRVPSPGDWLAEHKERGQTYAEYTAGNPVRPTDRRRFIRIQPIGTFTPKQDAIVRTAAEYMERFFGVTTTLNGRLGTGGIPPEARRERFGGEQLLTSWIRNRMLLPMRRGDTLACVGFTSNDLWPGNGWNFVYGEASLRDRVGVWSIARNGDPEESEEAYRLCLRRTIKVGIAYECVMNGSNHRLESDGAPLFLCPNCLAKLCWNTGQDPTKRYESMLEFFETHQFEADRKRCEELLGALRK